jgi:hypothetical protein
MAAGWAPRALVCAAAGRGSALATTTEGAEMEIPKDQILSMLRDRGQGDKADQADRELPDKVDPEQHADLLSKVGIDPKDLMGGLGGVGEKLGL